MLTKKQKQEHGDKYSIAAAFGAMGSVTKKFVLEDSNTYPLKGIDIDKEYKLIQKKKSELSRHLRDCVIFAIENRDEFEKAAKRLLKEEEKERKQKQKEAEKLLKKEIKDEDK